MINLTIGQSGHGSRLDRLLRKRLPLLSLSAVYGLIRRGSVRVDGRKVKQDHRLSEGEQLEIDVDESEFSEQERPQNALIKLTKTEFFKRNFHVLFEDPSVLVCNKPAGLVVHPGSGHRHSDNLIDLAAAYILSTRDSLSPDPPVLMHRLDRDTSGVILLAKNTGIARRLHEEMRAGRFKKQYAAVAHNRPPEFEGTVTLGMRRNDRSRTGMKMSVSEDGEGLAASSTSYKIAEYRNDMSRLEILLHTGKTHQIRVHLAHLKSPVLGDERYGDRRLDNLFFASSQLPRRLYLHAHKLSFPHPKTGKTMTVTAPVPKEFGPALG
ncbi:MAG: RluA family pseudouridine synthase [Chitinispirillales bacterium]|jgi:RluA family pseudouridine synthase|nr:RluA family pseudouridine synthase [Chitinispirillales bacterium]